MNAKYNDVPSWDYTALFTAFAPDIKTKTFKVAKASELDKLLSDAEFNSATYPQVSDAYISSQVAHRPNKKRHKKLTASPVRGNEPGQV